MSTGNKHIEQRKNAGRIEEAVIEAIANFGLWLHAANGIECLDVSLHQVAQNTQSETNIMLAWRIGAKYVAQKSVDVRFVDGEPEVAQVLQRLYDIGGVADEIKNVALVGKTAAVGKPQRVSEVMQGDEWFHMAAAQICEHLPVTVDGGAIPLPLPRLNAAPFDAQAQSVVFHLLGPLKIAFRVVPPIAGVSSIFSGKNMPLLLPAIPLIVRIAALTLIRRRRRAPQKSARELQCSPASHRIAPSVA